MAGKRRGGGHGGAHRPPWGSVHPLLDLHGETGDDARRRVEAWLRARQGEGVRTVVVVTGRGLRSPGLPVLRGEVEEVLHALRGTVVAGFGERSGGGAFQVELRAPPPARHEPGAAARARYLAANPALRLQAEESLAELGIAPTPALVEAEMRRIAAEGGGGPQSSR